MKTYTNPSAADLDRAFGRGSDDLEAILPRVAEIFGDVESRGDTALREFGEQFDGRRLERFHVDGDELQRAVEALDPELRAALEVSIRNVRRFHEAQVGTETRVMTTRGVSCRRVHRPVGRAGLYAPGGTAPLFSSVIMLAVPAKLAGCDDVILCTPPAPEDTGWTASPLILAAAALTGVDRVFALGGAQAVAAMSLGTESVPRADKIFGPGNRWVTAAKVYAAQRGAAIDMPAGPSEVAVIAGPDADPDFVASDLLSQLEHGPDSRAVLIAWDDGIIEASLSALERQKADLPRRDVIEQSLERAAVVRVPGLDAALDASNAIAPEHLILSFGDAAAVVGRVQHAGSVFVGEWSPEAAGDYASGTNHTLPTAGAARAYSGVSLDSFRKTMTVQELTPEGMRLLAPTVETMAAAEGLDAHRIAAKLRREKAESAAESAAGRAGPGGRRGAGGRATDPRALFRPELATLEPYRAARHEDGTGIRSFLDANENPIGSVGSAGNNRYPDPLQRRVREEASRVFVVPEESIFAGNGSDEAIDLVVRLFCTPGVDRIAIPDPTYGMYKVAAESQGVEVVDIALKEDFTLDVEALLDAPEKVLFICRPNNPTGLLYDRGDVQRLVDEYPGMVVVDEAYADFAEDDSLLDLVGVASNLIVLRTLSKAWGLAGVRVGFAFAHPEVIRVLLGLKAPYNLSGPAQNLAVRALARAHRKDRLVAALLANRQLLVDGLSALDDCEEILPSAANFVLARFTDPDAAFQRFRKHGILVRRWTSKPRLAPYLRISVGTQDEVLLLLDVAAGDADAEPGYGHRASEPAAAGRRATVERSTKETKVAVTVDLDRRAGGVCETGVGFFDHMVDQIRRHADIYLDLKVDGDLEVDEHHSIEDAGLALGRAFREALGDLRDTNRYGFWIPMDEADAKVAIDFSGRPELVWRSHFDREKVGEFPTELTKHFFGSFANAAAATINIECRGENDHHRIEAIFKAFARALGQAVRRDPFREGIPSSKGSLGEQA